MQLICITPSPQPRRKPLNLPASLFENFVRSRVRDAEIRAEAKRCAMHGGNTFRLKQFGDEVLIRRNDFA